MSRTATARSRYGRELHHEPLEGQTFLYIKHSVPRMLESGSGSIVNISTMASVMGMAGLPAYTTAKGGMNALTRYVAAEYGKRASDATRSSLGSWPTRRTRRW